MPGDIEYGLDACPTFRERVICLLTDDATGMLPMNMGDLNTEVLIQGMLERFGQPAYDEIRQIR